MKIPLVPLESSALAHPATPTGSHDDDALRATARSFEAAFIAEMLRHSGLSEGLAGDSGFAGETFASLLIDRYAEEMAADKGFGLADKIYRQLRNAP